MCFWVGGLDIPGLLTMLVASRSVCVSVYLPLWCSMRTLRSKLLLGKKLAMDHIYWHAHAQLMGSDPDRRHDRLSFMMTIIILPSILRTYGRR